MTSTSLSPLDENYFLEQVEITVANVLSDHRNSNNNNNENDNRDNISNADYDVDDLDIMDLPGPQREAFGIARHLNRRLSALRRNNDCPRCWMQRKHCICSHCKSVSSTIIDHNKKYIHYDNNNDKQTTWYQNVPPVDSSSNSSSVLKRIFVIMHHKEIGLKVDTAKLILASFPFQCELVIGGIGPKYQDSMKQLLESIDDPTTTSLVLFPDESANTLKEIIVNVNNNNNKLTNGRNFQNQTQIICDNTEGDDNTANYDLIVLDGTWAQARKFHSRYFPSLIEGNNEENNNSLLHRRRILSLRHVQLSDEAVQLLHNGSTKTGEYQLRRHIIPWRQVGTFEAFRVFLSDWCQEFPNFDSNKNNDVKDDDDNDIQVWQKLESYQRIANAAALRELPPINKVR